LRQRFFYAIIWEQMFLKGDPMCHKLEGNGLWESSRMILPEHRKAIQRQMREQNKRTKPTLAQEEIDYIGEIVARSYHFKAAATFVLFDEYEDVEITGIVTRVDQQLKRFRVDHDGDWTWVKFDDVLKVRVMDED
jgi:hypothetical protein